RALARDAARHPGARERGAGAGRSLLAGLRLHAGGVRDRRGRHFMHPRHAGRRRGRPGRTQVRDGAGMIRAMRRIDLDFCVTRRAAPAAAWVLLALALAFIADLGVSYHGVRREAAAAEARLAAMPRPGAGAARARLPAPDEIRQARETYL